MKGIITKGGSTPLTLFGISNQNYGGDRNTNNLKYKRARLNYDETVE